MQRIKPDPLPTLHACPEHLADARLSAVYADTKATLGVPWMGVVTMAFAHYPAFYARLWGGLREVCRSEAFAQACNRLRAQAEAQVVSLQPRRLEAELQALGYSAPELGQIRALIEVFSAGNMPYLMIATIARLLLEGERFAAGVDLQPARAMPALAATPLVLIEPHHAEAQTAALYADIRRTLGLPFVNTDYRALARWPSYFARAWQDLQPQVETPAYAAIVDGVHRLAVEQALALPLPPQLNGAALQSAAAADAPVAEVLDVVRLFQWLLPGLVSNVAFLRAQLG